MVYAWLLCIQSVSSFKFMIVCGMQKKKEKGEERNNWNYSCGFDFDSSSNIIFIESMIDYE